MEIIDDMYDRGFNIWYDEGIEVGSEWTECIASHLAGASLMIGFVTDNYMASDNCRREMNFAVQKKKHVINVFLSPTTLTPGMELQIGGIFALMKYTFPSEEYFFERLYSAPALRSENFGADPETIEIQSHREKRETEKTQRHEAHDERRRLKNEERAERRASDGDAPVIVVDEPRAAEPPVSAKAAKKRLVRGLTAAFLALLVIAAGVLWYVGGITGFTGRFWNKHFTSAEAVEMLPDDTVAAFTDPVFEAAAREYCGKAEGELTVGDLSGLTELHITGDSYSMTAPESGAQADGDLTRGTLEDLSDLAYFTDLQTLEISMQPLSSLKTLPESNITSLRVSSCRLTSLDGIGALPLLRLLDASSNSITDISELSGCTLLEALDLTGASVNDYSAAAHLSALSKLSVSNASLSQIRALVMCGALTDVRFINCDLRGNLFDIMDSPSLMYLTLEDCVLDATSNIEKLTGLRELTLIRVTGVTDWSELALCTTINNIYIDSSMADYISGATVISGGLNG